MPHEGRCVAETVVVTGESPTVDVTSTRNQQTLSAQTIFRHSLVPKLFGLHASHPAINVQQNDFEGSNPALYSVFQIHGGRRNEGQVLVDGMSGGYQGMGVSGYVPEVGNSQEVVFNWPEGWRSDHRRPADEHHRQAGRQPVRRRLLHSALAARSSGHQALVGHSGERAHRHG